MKAGKFFRKKTALECKVDLAKKILAKHMETHVEKPKNLRPAKASDIVEGAIIWYPKWAELEDFDDDMNEIPVQCWKEVYEVKWPDDAFKAYTADDGCRYGLDGAYVEEE